MSKITDVDFGLGLWLMPCKEDRVRLKPVIQGLSEGFDGPVFEPHITMATHLQITACELLLILEAQVPPLPNIQVQFPQIRGKNQFFQCLYLESSPPKSLLDLRALICEHIDSPLAIYEPHLSLFYGELCKANFVKALNFVPFLLPTKINFDRLAIYQIKGPCSNWTQIGEIFLTQE
jgi:hypothetical protein